MTLGNLYENFISLISWFNQLSPKRKPAILTLGLSASKFTDLDKPKTNSNPLLKYFNNDSKQSASANTNLDDSNKEEAPEKSNSKNSSELLSDELTALSNNSNLFNVIEPTTSRTAAARLDESDLDADLNFENSNDNLIDSKLTDTKSLFKNNKTSPSGMIELPTMVPHEPSKESSAGFVDDIDYVKCEKCGKKILAWEFPEHEDFHYAQDLSKQICVSAPQACLPASNTADTNKKKRSLTEAAGKNSNDQNTSEPVVGKRAPAKSKKIKIEINAKPINNYFKKL